ncbi:MAG: hypothetical protein U0350_10145 [Caldilineaceae bacterium]
MTQTPTFTFEEKKPGDLIQSQDWNKAMQQLVNLGNALPPVAQMSALLDQAIAAATKKILYSRWAVTVLADNVILVDPNDPPHATLDGNKVTYGGTVWFRAPDNAPPNASPGFTPPLLRLYPPPTALTTGQIGIFGVPRTNLALQSTLEVRYQINPDGGLQIDTFAEGWVLGLGRIDLAVISYSFTPLAIGKQ